MPTFRIRNGKCQAIVRIKQNGTIVHQESRTFDSETLAKDWAKRLEAKIKQDGLPSRKMQVETLGNLAQRYKEHCDGFKPLRRTAAAELDQITSWFHSTKLSALTSSALTKFADERHRAGAGPATILHNLSTIRTVLNAAKPVFGIPINGDVVNEAIAALAKTGRVSKSKKRERRLSDAEIAKLCEEYERTAHFPSTVIPMATVVKLALHLPRRRSELCSMKWEDYDRKKGTLRLWDTKHPTITRNETIPVPHAAQAIINSLPVIDERILPYEPESISASFERACERLGIVDARFHDLRHEGISRLFEMGLEIQEVALISGHTSWTTLKRYTHLKPEQVLEKLDARYKQTNPVG